MAKKLKLPYSDDELKLAMEAVECADKLLSELKRIHSLMSMSNGNARREQEIASARKMTPSMLDILTKVIDGAKIWRLHWGVPKFYINNIDGSRIPHHLMERLTTAGYMDWHGNITDLGRKAVEEATRK